MIKQGIKRNDRSKESTKITGQEDQRALTVDTAVAHLDLEGALVTPGVVPGVNAEPVVFTVLRAPADRLDGVAAESGTSLMLVDARLVGQEVLVDGEGRGHCSVLLDVSLNVGDTTEAIAGGREVLVVGVDAAWVIRARLRASGRNLLDVVTERKSLAVDVMGALLHCVVVASAGSAEVAAGDDAASAEPGPRGSDLATVAAKREAFGAIAAGCRVRN
eukprot:CAMPEP_0185577312 /NCGR_PEP_ID=MMETSP0434-20130131/9842_1 /TAXON_ID=626734 ORGANISM="Favella taraikaensis, Strain Fe Narragansett Bay" /NCGR_SAMPLE_ID=MMETSP0434 /ASSEMBLY_ACC=CAM_ASM_000379 /LENGTH=217 /DNA_ID=CAMNT_0028194859 /DNA_START=43 /DNA_END=697 /DNA_ORIENTATION=+